MKEAPHEVCCILRFSKEKHAKRVHNYKLQMQGSKVEHSKTDGKILDNGQHQNTISDT